MTSTRRLVRFALALVGLAPLGALACNAIVGNGPVELETFDASLIPKRDAAGDAGSIPDDVITVDDGGADGSSSTCPPPTCTTNADCPDTIPIFICITLTGADGGALTRACRHPCEAGAGCAAYEQCISGSTPACIPTNTVCGASCQMICNQRCINPATDPANCGRCGAQCPTGKTCNGGACI